MPVTFEQVEIELQIKIKTFVFNVVLTLYTNTAALAKYRDVVKVLHSNRALGEFNFSLLIRGSGKSRLSERSEEYSIYLSNYAHACKQAVFASCCYIQL